MHNAKYVQAASEVLHFSIVSDPAFRFCSLNTFIVQRMSNVHLVQKEN